MHSRPSGGPRGALQPVELVGLSTAGENGSTSASPFLAGECPRAVPGGTHSGLRRRPTMSRSPETRPSLLVRIRDARDVTAWNEFVELYAPLLHAYLRARGLQDADSSDITQEVLQTLATRIDRFDYQPAQGSFRGWLLKVTLNKLRDHIQRRRGQVQGTGDRQVQRLLADATDDSAEEAWSHMHAWRLFLWAAEKSRADFREKTWQAFWRTTVDQQPTDQVAAELGMTAGAIHIAKCRVMARVKEQLQGFDVDAEEPSDVRPCGASFSGGPPSVHAVPRGGSHGT